MIGRQKSPSWTDARTDTADVDGGRCRLCTVGGRRSRAMPAIAALILLLAGLGCGICPSVPQRPTVTPLPSPSPLPAPTETPLPEPSPTQEPPSTPEVSAETVEMVSYTNSLIGFTILHPADWVYQVGQGEVYFGGVDVELEQFDPASGAMLSITSVPPQEMQLEFGSQATAWDVIQDLVEDLRAEEGAEIGTIEDRSFGEVPGAVVEVSWDAAWSDIRIHGYLFAVVDGGMARVGFGGSPEGVWPSYEPLLQSMLASLEFFPPQVPEPVEKGSIQAGEVVQSTLPLGGTDVWYFEAQEGQYVTIRMDAVDPDLLDPYLELYDGQGLLVAEDDDGGEDTNARIVDFPISASATYAIHALTYAGEGEYVLSVEVAEEPTRGGTIEYGQTVREALGVDVEQGWFFEGSEGDVVTIAMRSLDEDLDSYLVLYGPDGLLLTEDDDSGEDLDALIEYYELPADGTYRIVAQGALYGEAGTYELALERAEAVIEGVLNYGDTVEAVLESGVRHHWLFDGQEGDIVTIAMRARTEEMDTYLELFAPDGVRVRVDDDSGGDSDAEIADFELPLSGTYRIIARGYSDDDVGRYMLSLSGP